MRIIQTSVTGEGEFALVISTRPRYLSSASELHLTYALMPSQVALVASSGQSLVESEDENAPSETKLVNSGWVPQECLSLFVNRESAKYVHCLSLPSYMIP